MLSQFPSSEPKRIRNFTPTVETAYGSLDQKVQPVVPITIHVLPFRKNEEDSEDPTTWSDTIQIHACVFYKSLNPNSKSGTFFHGHVHWDHMYRYVLDLVMVNSVLHMTRCKLGYPRISVNADGTSSETKGYSLMDAAKEWRYGGVNQTSPMEKMSTFDSIEERAMNVFVRADRKIQNYWGNVYGGQWCFFLLKEVEIDHRTTYNFSTTESITPGNTTTNEDNEVSLIRTVPRFVPYFCEENFVKEKDLWHTVPYPLPNDPTEFVEKRVRAVPIKVGLCLKNENYSNGEAHLGRPKNDEIGNLKRSEDNVFTLTQRNIDMYYYSF